jgi:putative ATPase
MILWGPPGCGKTTLALLLAQYAQAEFKAISAVLSGLLVLAEAAQRFADGRRTMLFVDEVGRFKKPVKSYINQRLTKSIVQIFGLPHCSEWGNHA